MPPRISPLIGGAKGGCHPLHAAHTAAGIVKGEDIRYLTKSSRKEFYIEDCLMLLQAFKNRGYSKRMLKVALGPLIRRLA